MTSASVSTAEVREQGVGIRVIAMLAALTVLEFLLAIGLHGALLLLLTLTPVAILKTWLIAVYFMRLPRLWRGEEEEA